LVIKKREENLFLKESVQVWYTAQNRTVTNRYLPSWSMLIMQKMNRSDLSTLPAWFRSYLEPAADRPGILHAELAAAGIHTRQLELAGGRYLVAQPRGGKRDDSCRQKIITAHHDRVPGTPGALDNSAAAWQLVDFLLSTEASVNTTVIFTDHEELSGNAVTKQGSWAVGCALATLGYRKPLLFCLDVCGRGDTLVLSSAAASLADYDPELGQLAAEVDEAARHLLRYLGNRFPARQARVPFGEDLGFLCSGQVALVLTVLPRAEYEALSGFSFEHVGNQSEVPRNLPPWAALRAPGIPDTWRYLHSENDTPALFTPEAFVLMGETIQRLGQWRLPQYIG